MKNITLFFALVCSVALTSQAFAQTSIDRQVIGSAGQLLHSASGATMLFTLGETAIHELATECTLAQGFHQDQAENVTLLSAQVATQIHVTVQVYPNPVSDLLYIESETPLLSTLFDLQGRVVVSTTAVNQSETLQLTSLSPGTYVLRTNLPNGTPANTFRIQVMH
ncbi:MAG: T9SS type A sorting domain-containing protein [Chitinophagales bacterium]|nr:T9SS type A sorting domain-containing protein [Chitinophagales bacterium]